MLGRPAWRLFLDRGTDGETPSKPLHNAGYDFNDDLIGTRRDAVDGAGGKTAAGGLTPMAEPVAIAVKGRAMPLPNTQAFTAAFRRAFMSL